MSRNFKAQLVKATASDCARADERIRGIPQPPLPPELEEFVVSAFTEARQGDRENVLQALAERKSNISNLRSRWVASLNNGDRTTAAIELKKYLKNIRASADVEATQLDQSLGKEFRKKRHLKICLMTLAALVVGIGIAASYFSFKTRNKVAQLEQIADADADWSLVHEAAGSLLEFPSTYFLLLTGKRDTVERMLALSSKHLACESRLVDISRRVQEGHFATAEDEYEQARKEFPSIVDSHVGLLPHSRLIVKGPPETTISYVLKSSIHAIGKTDNQGIFSRSLLGQGERLLQYSMRDRKPFESVIVVRPGSDRAVRVAFPTDTGAVMLSGDTDAEIYYQGGLIATEGEVIENLAPGTHTFELKKPQHEDQVLTVTVVSDEVTSLRIPAFKPLFGHVYIVGDTEMRVFDAHGTLVGKLNDWVKLPVGEHTLVIRDAGGASKPKRVVVESGQRDKLVLSELSSPYGELRVQGPSDVTVHDAKGNILGKANATIGLLPIGSQAITLRRPQHEEASIAIFLNPGELSKIQAPSLIPLFAYIEPKFFVAQPSGAKQIYPEKYSFRIDGSSWSTVSLTLPRNYPPITTSVGKHTFEVKFEGYAPIEPVRVDLPEGGKTVAASFSVFPYPAKVFLSPTIDGTTITLNSASLKTGEWVSLPARQTHHVLAYAPGYGSEVVVLDDLQPNSETRLEIGLKPDDYWNIIRAKFKSPKGPICHVYEIGIGKHFHETRPQLDLVLLLDNSSNLSKLSRSSLYAGASRILTSLRPTDRIQLITSASQPKPQLPQLAFCTRATKLSLQSALEKFKVGKPEGKRSLTSLLRGRDADAVELYPSLALACREDFKDSRAAVILTLATHNTPLETDNARGAIASIANLNDGNAAFYSVFLQESGGGDSIEQPLWQNALSMSETTGGRVMRCTPQDFIRELSLLTDDLLDICAVNLRAIPWLNKKRNANQFVYPKGMRHLSTKHPLRVLIISNDENDVSGIRLNFKLLGNNKNAEVIIFNQEIDYDKALEQRPTDEYSEWMKADGFMRGHHDSSHAPEE
jgi:hypothetical protein